MRRVHSADTAPEKKVRSLLHKLGFRFRLQRKDLPGKPDIILPKHKTVVFIHGCFWHRHPGCSRATTPATNQDYWLPKFDRTIKRDLKSQNDLRRIGWNVIVVWECELRDLDLLSEKLKNEIPAPQCYSDSAPILPMAAEQQETYQKKEDNSLPHRFFRR